MTTDTIQQPQLTGSELAKINNLLRKLGITFEQAKALAAQNAAPKPSGKQLCEVMDEFVRSRMQSGIRSASVRWFSTRLSPLYIKLGQRQADKIERADLKDVLSRMPVSASTKNNYARAWGAVWKWGLKQDVPPFTRDVTFGLAPRPNKQERDGAEFLTVENATKMMHGIAPAYRSGAAILLFAGVRPQELWGTDKKPLLWGHVNVTDRILRVPSDIAKTRKGRVLEGLPDALWAWLTPGKPDEPICPAQSQYLIRIMQRAAGFYELGYGRAGTWKKLRDWPHDGTRHSFATYALALTSDAARVSMWLGHEGNSTMLHRHYRGMTTKAEAERYFAIRPQPATS